MNEYLPENNAHLQHQIVSNLLGFCSIRSFKRSVFFLFST